jgi:CheY-specific phosphatase CheX
MPSFILADVPTNTSVTGSLEYDAVTRTASFTATQDLKPDTEYKVKITTDAKDIAGNSLASEFVWQFKTGAEVDVTPPTVVAVSPSDGAIDVGLSKVISATFSEPMDAATLTA